MRVRERVLRSAASKPHNLGSRSSGGHPAGGVARASEPQSPGRSPASPHDSMRIGVGGSAPRSLCARCGAGRSARECSPAAERPECGRSRHAALLRPPPRPGGWWGGRKSRERGIGATLGPRKHVAENAEGCSPVGAGRRARPAAGAGPRGAARRRPSAPAPQRAPAPRRGCSRPSAAAGPACAPLRGRGGAVGAEGLRFHCSGGSCVLVRK